MTETFFQFNKLTPNQNINLNGYEEAMRFVFDNSDLKNIAISGAYGSGKSSLLESYKTKHTDIKFLNISLASFKNKKQN